MSGYPGRCSAKPASLPLVTKGAPRCRILDATGDPQALLVRRATGILADAVRDFSGVDLPVLQDGDGAGNAGMPAIVLMTGKRFAAAAPAAYRHAMNRCSWIAEDEYGFAIVPWQAAADRLYIVGTTIRGVHDGAVYTAEFLVDGTSADLSLELSDVFRRPGLGARGVYLLTIWGNEPLYTADDWKVVLDSCARDGLDRVYFWASGHFPSERFPRTFRCTSPTRDSTADTRIGSVTALQTIIRHAHELGLRIYLGGALGVFCGTAFVTDLEPGTIRQGPEPRGYCLCPSHPLVRRNLVGYYREMAERLPEADGLYLDTADEYGDCLCRVCQTEVGEPRRTQYSLSQITLLQEIAAAVWEANPSSRICCSAGWPDHDTDAPFYDMARRLDDPRFEWLEMCGAWDLPMPGGGRLPAPAVLPRLSHQGEDYQMKPLETIIREASRAASLGFEGLSVNFQPGYDRCGSCYDRIPFPVDRLPYLLMSFVQREASWEPSLSVDAMRRRTGRRFFGSGIPLDCADDLWEVREIIRESWYGGGLRPDADKRLLAIDRRIEDRRPKMLRGLLQMKQAISDARTFFASAGSCTARPYDYQPRRISLLDMDSHRQQDPRPEEGHHP